MRPPSGAPSVFMCGDAQISGNANYSSRPAIMKLNAQEPTRGESSEAYAGGYNAKMPLAFSGRVLRAPWPQSN